MIIDLRTLFRLIKKGDYEIIGLAYPITAVIGSLGYISFYFADKSLGLYDNIYLRIITAFLFIQLYFLKKNFNSLKIFAVEFVLVLCLPLFYSYFYYATNQSTSWGAGLIFCGFTYGVMTGKIFHTFTIFPMFLMLGFFLHDRFFMESTMQQFFYSIAIISLSILTALLSSIVKLIFEYALIVDISSLNKQKRLIKNEKLRGSNDYNQCLKKDLNKVKKLDAMSKLTGGLIKDFNESINTISLKCVELKEFYNADSSKLQRLDTVIDVIKKSSSMIHSISALTLNSDDQFNLEDINHIIDGLVKLITKSIDQNTKVSVLLSAQKNTIYGNKEMLEQAFFNICINAIQAMPNGGELLITTENSLSVSTDEYKNGSEQIIIHFKDTGSGMDQQTREKIFRPFFSTKGAGKGRGIGLAIVYETIKHHNGSITVDSTPSQGTTFSITLPVRSTGDECRGRV